MALIVQYTLLKNKIVNSLKSCNTIARLKIINKRSYIVLFLSVIIGYIRYTSDTKVKLLCYFMEHLTATIDKYYREKAVY